MEWLRAHYDRAAVLAGALFLLLCAFFIFLSTARFSERYEALQNVPPRRDKMPVGEASAMVAATARLGKPPQWNAGGRSGLFVPEKHFLGADGQPVTLQNTQLHPPVPNDWIEAFGLPMTDADVLTQDADGDGFTNLDEWQGKTNPTEQSQHPPYAFKLKLRSFVKEAFPLILLSSVNEVYAINNVDPRIPTQFLQLGEMVAGTKYKLTDYQEKFETNQYGTTINVSELTLEQVETHDRVVLAMEKRAASPESVANFIYTWNGANETFAVKKDQEFSLKPEEVKYKLLDVQTEKAVIVDTRQPNEKVEIGPIQP